MSSEKAPAIFGRYQVLEELGSGAMGVVYLGVDPRLARPVAIKVIRESDEQSAADREQYFARFRHEAEAAGRMNHPDIVQIYDIGPSYLVMEYLEGRPLSAFMKAGIPLPIRQVCSLILRVADAIDYAHRQGIVHRDIKPANIMLTDDGGVKVMDFGVARLESSTLTVAGTVLGSVRYMSPEQMMGEKVDGRADIFSLSAVAYELLTGKPPFPGKTITEVVSKVVHGQHVPPRQVDERLPEGLNSVFAKAFAPRPQDRYVTAMAFAQELHEAAQAVLDLDTRQEGAPAPPTPTEIDLAQSLAAELESTRDTGDLSPTEIATASESDGLRPAPPATTAAPVEPRPAAPAKGRTGETTRSGITPITAAAVPPTARSGAAVVPPTARSGATAVPPAGSTGTGGPRSGSMLLSKPPTGGQREGVLLLDSDPPGARISVDGAPLGKAPLSGVEVSFGRHVIRMEVEGRPPVSAEIDMRPERPLKGITFTLPSAESEGSAVKPGQFVPFGPDVVPPARVEGALPAYPAAARERGMEGSPVVEVWVSETGHVMDVAIVESAGATLDGALLEAVAGWRFSPATLNGVSVSVRMTVQHLFRR
jgi:TonB family protein